MQVISRTVTRISSILNINILHLVVLVYGIINTVLSSMTRRLQQTSLNDVTFRITTPRYLGSFVPTAFEFGSYISSCLVCRITHPA